MLYNINHYITQKPLCSYRVGITPNILAKLIYSPKGNFVYPFLKFETQHINFQFPVIKMRYLISIAGIKKAVRALKNRREMKLLLFYFRILFSLFLPVF